MRLIERMKARICFRDRSSGLSGEEGFSPALAILIAAFFIGAFFFVTTLRSGYQKNAVTSVLRDVKEKIQATSADTADTSGVFPVPVGDPSAAAKKKSDDTDPHFGVPNSMQNEYRFFGYIPVYVLPKGVTVTSANIASFKVGESHTGVTLSPAVVNAMAGVLNTMVPTTGVQTVATLFLICDAIDPTNKNCDPVTALGLSIEALQSVITGGPSWSAPVAGPSSVVTPPVP